MCSDGKDNDFAKLTSMQMACKKKPTEFTPARLTTYTVIV